MTGTETEIQWYIAREGKQYGPLNDAELRMFIAGGHLRPTDLVWRPGMADWRQASSVFSLKPRRPRCARFGTGRRARSGYGGQASWRPWRWVALRVPPDQVSSRVLPTG